MKKKKAIILFAKYPEEGKVKSRLAKTTGNNFAVDFYKLNSKYIFEEVDSLQFDELKCYLFFSGSSNSQKENEWAKYNFTILSQMEGDLGKRMLTAFKTVFAHGHESAVIIGTDVPDLTSDIIKRSFEILENKDFVVGPSFDGGYYLMGMNKLYPELFTGIEWSTSTVLQNTLNKCRSLNLNFSQLGKLHDIDNERQLHEWLADKSAGNLFLKNQIRNLYGKLIPKGKS